MNKKLKRLLLTILLFVVVFGFVTPTLVSASNSGLVILGLTTAVCTAYICGKEIYKLIK